VSNKITGKLSSCEYDQQPEFRRTSEFPSKAFHHGSDPDGYQLQSIQLYVVYFQPIEVDTTEIGLLQMIHNLNLVLQVSYLLEGIQRRPAMQICLQ
jgi:hypothetical protein